MNLVTDDIIAKTLASGTHSYIGIFIKIIKNGIIIPPPPKPPATANIFINPIATNPHIYKGPISKGVF